MNADPDGSAFICAHENVSSHSATGFAFLLIKILKLCVFAGFIVWRWVSSTYHFQPLPATT